MLKLVELVVFAKSNSLISKRIVMLLRYVSRSKSIGTPKEVCRFSRGFCPGEHCLNTLDNITSDLFKPIKLDIRFTNSR